MLVVLLPLSSAAIIAVWSLYTRRQCSKNYPLPPGPRQFPFFGNYLQFPMVDQFMTLASWAKIYGPLLYLTIFGRKFIILSSLASVTDLLEKKSGLYSARPRMVMARELVGREENSIVFMGYGKRLKEARRLMHSWINKSAMREAYPAQETGAIRLLSVLLEDPEHFSEHIRTELGRVSLKLTYGIDCAQTNDPYLAKEDYLSEIVAEATRPGRWLCDFFPILAKLPSWFPFAGFQTWAVNARKVTTELIRAPFDAVMETVLEGNSIPSYVAQAILKKKTDKSISAEENAQVLITAGGSMYAGGIDTLVATLRTFFLVMARYPEIQRKAQDEIDRVVGNERLPNIGDRDALPYVAQLIAEVLRFNPVVPLVPHSLDEDDFYEGYRVPKGSWVVANVWAILHDPLNYKDPEEFRPERFAASESKGSGEPDLSWLCFGFGRRACPGTHYAMSALFLNIACVLAVFDVGPGQDGIPPPLMFDTGHLRTPREFRCSITPRSKARANLVRDLAAL